MAEPREIESRRVRPTGFKPDLPHDGKLQIDESKGFEPLEVSYDTPYAFQAHALSQTQPTLNMAEDIGIEPMHASLHGLGLANQPNYHSSNLPVYSYEDDELELEESEIISAINTRINSVCNS